MKEINYLMENDEESYRLDIKTDSKVVEKQALWAGIKPGMRVADFGCGPGKTTFVLHGLVQPSGAVIGVDGSEKRIEYAKKHYGVDGIEFTCKDIREPLDDLGMFDFVWVRFVLEYYRSKSFDIVKNISQSLKPEGILCLIDLDCNCLNHFGFSQRLERTIRGVMSTIEKHADFDPYAGRKLYSFLYDLGYQDIDVNFAPHHLILGKFKETEVFDWMKKLEVAARSSGYRFEEYRGGFEEFFEECKSSFANPRIFIYTPVISCKGIKPDKEII